MNTQEFSGQNAFSGETCPEWQVYSTRIAALIIAHEGPDLTDKAIGSMYSVRPPWVPREIRPHETVVFDNGSRSETYADVGAYWLCGYWFYPRVIRSNENLPFGQAVNRGLHDIFTSDSDTQAVILFNNDIEVKTEDWVARFLKHLEHYDIVGLGHTHVNYKGSDAEIEDLPKYSYVGFWCVAISRKAWTEVGDLDYTTFPFYYEDRDYCYRAQDIGLKIGIAHDIDVEHKNNATVDALKLDKEALGRTAHDAFIRKWGFLNDPVEKDWDSTKRTLGLIP